MELVYWWVIPAWIAATAAALLIARARRKKMRLREAESTLHVANPDRYATLPSFARAVRTYRLRLTIAIGAAIVLLSAAALTTARVVTESVTRPELRNRDIMLCLDVSGSMTAADAEVVKSFAKLARGFDGERIGLTMFDSSSVSVFPLTNDKDFIVERLDELGTALKVKDGSNYEIFNGTIMGQGSSLIGDGLASCVLRFDNLDEKRSRSVILATDNAVSGSQLITLPEAAALAKSKDVRVYGLNPNDYSSGDYEDDLAKEFRKAMDTTDGDYFALKSTRSVPAIIDQITSQEATVLKTAPQRIRNDRPQVVGIFAILGISALLVAAWRLKS